MKPVKELRIPPKWGRNGREGKNGAEEMTFFRKPGEALYKNCTFKLALRFLTVFLRL